LATTISARANSLPSQQTGDDVNGQSGVQETDGKNNQTGSQETDGQNHQYGFQGEQEGDYTDAEPLPTQ
jgi:hypothetical protein